MTKSLLGEGAAIHSLVVINNDETRMIAGGDDDGCVKLWNLRTYDCMGSFKTCSKTIRGLQVIRYNGRVCLMCRGDGHTMKVWNFMF